MKPVDYDAFLNHKYFSDALISCIGYIAVAKKKDNASTATSTCFKNKSYEVSSKNSKVNEPQEKQSNYNEISIDLAYSPFKKYILFIDKYGGIPNGGTSMRGLMFF